MDWDGQERRRVLQQCQTQILERLTKIEVETSLMRSLLKDIHVAIHGNGKDGLMIRHDRVEQKMFLVWGLLVAVGGLTFKAILEVVVR